MIDEVSRHIADRSCSPIEPASPVERMIDRMIGDVRGRSDEKIPIDSGRDWIVAIHSRGKRLVDRPNGPFAAEALLHASITTTTPPHVSASLSAVGTSSLHRNVGYYRKLPWSWYALRPESNRT